MRHLPNLQCLDGTEIRAILSKAAEIKADPARYDRLLHRKSMAMLFQKTSTRTRVSFEVAMTELGGHAIYIDWATSNFVLSGIEHETAYLSRNVSCIMARLYHHSDLQKIMSASLVPVINGCDELYHPCQALTDVLTMQEHYAGDLQDAHLAFIGVQNNVSNSLITICDKLGITMTIATPEQEGNTASADATVNQILQTSDRINHTTDPREAVKNADFVYTDTWIDMQYFNNPEHSEENEAKLALMKPYQLNSALLDGIDCKTMHDMPIHDGFEISAELTRDPRAIMYEQAANRLHAQKGLLWWLYSEAGNLS
ncbi:MAG: ornithine carbamoyltransferase [SAR86 cluster bacterium]|uniref:Ornithine carbamoyltransferase n=1 Tax=SAR86 cluster bacterium TaxID=2030880 RepID=A0A972VX35_9GAMM|nr:ornithine carbamoyltransferase [SAR86 cluster bacterium]